MNIREKQADKMAQSKQAGRRFLYLYLHEGERKQKKTRMGPMRGEKRKKNLTKTFSIFSTFKSQ